MRKLHIKTNMLIVENSFKDLYGNEERQFTLIRPEVLTYIFIITLDQLWYHAYDTLM